MKTYRNLLAELGIAQSDIDKRINDCFNTMFYGTEDERIYHPVEPA